MPFDAKQKQNLQEVSRKIVRMQFGCISTVIIDHLREHRRTLFINLLAMENARRYSDAGGPMSFRVELDRSYFSRPGPLFIGKLPQQRRFRCRQGRVKPGATHP